MGGFLTEIPFNHAGIIDAPINRGRGINSMIEDDRHLPAYILLRKRPEAPSGLSRKRKVDDPLAGVVCVAIFRGAAKIAARDDWRSANDIPPLTLGRSRGSGATIHSSGQKFRTRRQNATMFAQCVGLRSVDDGILEEPQFELATLLNDTFGARGVALTGQLHKNFVAVLPASKLNRGLR
jgi:hypothetical protein